MDKFREYLYPLKFMSPRYIRGKPTTYVLANIMGARAQVEVGLIKS